MITPISGYSGNVELEVYGSIPITSWTLVVSGKEIDITGNDSNGVLVTDIAGISYAGTFEFIFDSSYTWLEDLDLENLGIDGLTLYLTADQKYVQFSSVDYITGYAGIVSNIQVSLNVNNVVKVSCAFKMNVKPTYFGTTGE